MTSPTLELLYQQQENRMSSNEHSESDSEVTRLMTENETLRRKLAHLTAQYIWTEGGSHAKINEDIRQYGYRLERMTNGYDPRIVPITRVAVAANTAPSPPPEKVAGPKPQSHWGIG